MLLPVTVAGEVRSVLNPLPLREGPGEGEHIRST
jgi:hypothetical protein